MDGLQPLCLATIECCDWALTTDMHAGLSRLQSANQPTMSNSRFDEPPCPSTSEQDLDLSPRCATWFSSNAKSVLPLMASLCMMVVAV